MGGKGWSQGEEDPRDGRKEALDPKGALESWVGLVGREEKMES